MGTKDPNLLFRERRDPAMYPPNWDVREDGSRTDGGILNYLTYIIPEHLRIWEYNLPFGQQIRPVDTGDIVTAIETLPDEKPEAVLEDQTLMRAIETFWVACSQRDGAERCVQLVKTLDILTADERAGKAPGEIFKEIRDIIRKEKAVPRSREDLIGILALIDSMIPISMTNRIASLIKKVRPGDKNLPGRILKLRGKFAHGRGQEPPPGDELEELHNVVWACLDYHIHALQNGQPKKP